MTNPLIRVMTDADIDFALGMTTIEGWGNCNTDFPRLLALEPEGCFVAMHDGNRVGMITTTTYETYAFLGSLIVARECRKRGYGHKLLEHAIEYLKGRGVTTIELDGVLAAVPLYRRLGFQEKYMSLRFSGTSESVTVAAERYRPGIRQEILQLDRELTGMDRVRVIGRLLQEFAGSCYVHSGDGVDAYTIVRERSTGNLACGPLVARTPGAAAELFRGVLSLYSGKSISLGVPALSKAMVDSLHALDFDILAPSLRMYLGERIDYERHVYAIVSPEKG